MDARGTHHRLAPTRPRRLARGASALLLGGLLLVGAAACPEPESAHVAPDPKMRVKLIMARKTLARIRERRLRGLEIEGDCRAAERLFFAPLEKMQHRKAKRLRRDLVQICATDRRDRGERGVVGP